MTRKLMRFMSLLLVLCMLVSLAACKPKKKKPAENPGSTTSTNDTSSTPDDITSEIIDGMEDPDGILDIVDTAVVRPVTDGAISVGIKLEYVSDEEKDPFEDGDLEGEEDGDWVVDDDLVDEFEYEFLIQPYGTLEVKGKKRVIEVTNSKDGILFTNFSGVNTNVYPTLMTLMAQRETYSEVSLGAREAFIEINGDRFNNIKASYARCWFQIDWMMTNECEEKGLNYEDFDKNWEKNPDYVNYYNGIYDFDNEYMQSCVEYWSMLEDAGTDIYLAFGWKIATRIQGWFSSDMRYPRESAPRDLDAYADAAVALYKYIREDVGLTNFNILSFYNEPNWNAPGENTYQDFSVTGDKRVWWMNMVKKCREAFDKNGLEDVTIASSDHVGEIMKTDDKYLSVYIKDKIPEIVDMWTFHLYPDSSWLQVDGIENEFKMICKAMRFLSCYYGENSYITEYYGSILHDPSSIYTWEKLGWQGSNAAFLIAAANNGVRGNFHWGFTGGFLCDPMMFDPATGSSAAWQTTTGEVSINAVQHAFYEGAILNNYIPKDANVHNINWSGEDIRAAAFTSPDGKDFSLVVEANEKCDDKELEVKLSESLDGRDLNVFYYDWDLEYTPNAIIPSLHKTIRDVKSSFSYDEIDGNYGIYVFTTMEPVKQIALYKAEDVSKDAIYNFVSKGGTVSIKPQFIDINANPSKNNVIWEIKRYSCAPVGDDPKTAEKSVSLEKITDDLGELTVAADGTVTYKALDTAKIGDVIAIRCTLKSDKDVWCSAIIEVNS